MIIWWISTLLSLSAPCCGGTGGQPGLLLGNERATLAGTATYSTVIADAETGPRAEEDGEQTILLGTAAGVVIVDRFQVGGSFTAGSRKLDRPGLTGSGKGVGDLRLHVGYELLPLWTYSVWRPQGFIFLTGGIPTGKSTYESEEPGAVDAFGQGFWSIGVGVVFAKHWSYTDATLNSEVTYRFPRSFKTPRPISVEPGLQVANSIALGVSPWAGPIRLGGRIGPTWRDGGASILYGEKSVGRDRLFWDTIVELSCLFKDVISITASYSDQTLVNFSRNSALNRSVALSVQYRWMR